jgi:hypothetical protein
MTRYLKVTRVGRCEACGRSVPGRLLPDSKRECEGYCPRCGVKPFRLNNIGPYTGNVGAMSTANAIRWLSEMEFDDELETGFRLEMMRPEGPRDEVLEAGIERYHWLMSSAFLPVGKRLSLEELKEAWRQELSNPEVRHMYRGLITAHVGPVEDVIPRWLGQRPGDDHGENSQGNHQEAAQANQPAVASHEPI